jgi:Gpi18-like mannosyltransferase
MTEVRISKEKALWFNGFIFAGGMWLLSRLLIVATMLLLVPLLPAPPGGIKPTVSWEVYSWWDSLLYKQIATSGYEYANDGKGHNVAFFPVFPLVIRGVMTLGLPFEVAGILVNNLAFLGALIVLYYWVEERHSRSAARWATAVLAWCPLSLFGTVIYSEGLYLLFSTAAMQAFDKQKYAWVALWGAIATATRPTGMALIPAFVIATWRERRGARAYIASLAAAAGLLLFSLYCAIHFGDALAFIQAQRGWRPTLGFYWQGWLKMLMQISIGAANWKHGWLKDPLHPLLFGIIVGSGYLLWRFRTKIGSTKVGYGFCALVLFLWLLAGDQLINTAMVLGGGYLLWQLRTQLSLVTVIYGFCALGLILASGGTWSISRIAYGIVSLSIALGVLLERYPRWGYATMGFFTILLASFAVRFAQHLWIA